MKMDKQRWQQIETLYHAALERAPDERTAFLADACADDSGLLREVEAFRRAILIFIISLSTPARRKLTALSPPRQIAPVSSGSRGRLRR